MDQQGTGLKGCQMPLQIQVVHGFECLSADGAAALSRIDGFRGKRPELLKGQYDGCPVCVGCQKESFANEFLSIRAGRTVAGNENRVPPVTLCCLQKWIGRTVLLNQCFYLHYGTFEKVKNGPAKWPVMENVLICLYLNYKWSAFTGFVLRKIFLDFLCDMLTQR